jgi:hypothetical protein
MLNLFHHYFHGVEKPLRPTTESSSSIAASALYTAFIKTENTQLETTVNFALNHGNNPLPPAMIPLIDLNTNTEHQVLDVDGHPLRTTVNSFDELHSQLVNDLKRDPTKYVYGQIASSSTHKERPGHVFVYLACEGDVFYIDPQCYNGITRKGEPIFNHLALKQNYKQFKKQVYFLEHGVYQCDIEYELDAPIKQFFE